MRPFVDKCEAGILVICKAALLFAKSYRALEWSGQWAQRLWMRSKNSLNNCRERRIENLWIDSAWPLGCFQKGTTVRGELRGEYITDVKLAYTRTHTHGPLNVTRTVCWQNAKANSVSLYTRHVKCLLTSTYLTNDGIADCFFATHCHRLKLVAWHE